LGRSWALTITMLSLKGRSREWRDTLIKEWGRRIRSGSRSEFGVTVKNRKTVACGTAALLSIRGERLS